MFCFEFNPGCRVASSSLRTLQDLILARLLKIFTWILLKESMRRLALSRGLLRSNSAISGLHTLIIVVLVSRLLLWSTHVSTFGLAAVDATHLYISLSTVHVGVLIATWLALVCKFVAENVFCRRHDGAILALSCVCGSYLTSNSCYAALLFRSCLFLRFFVASRLLFCRDWSLSLSCASALGCFLNSTWVFRAALLSVSCWAVDFRVKTDNVTHALLDLRLLNTSTHRLQLFGPQLLQEAHFTRSHNYSTHKRQLVIFQEFMFLEAHWSENLTVVLQNLSGVQVGASFTSVLNMNDPIRRKKNALAQEMRKYIIWGDKLQLPA